MTPEEKIQLYFNVLAEVPDAELDDIASRLIAKGIDAEEAECMIAFVPMAFSHAVLSPAVKLPRSFMIMNTETGESVRGLLKNETLFTSALTLAQRMAAEGENSRRFVFQLAARSSELSVVDEMVRKGSEIRNIVLVEPVLLRISAGYLAKKKTSRWQFWKR